MKLLKLISIVGIFGGLAVAGAAQSPNQQLEEQYRRQQQIEARKRYDQEQRRREHMSNLVRMTDVPRDGLATTTTLFRFRSKYTFPLIRTSPQDRALKTVSVEDQEAFANILHEKDSGIFRIFDVAQCIAPEKDEKPDDKCPNDVFGRGTSYSFRHRDYVPSDFADLTLRDGIVASEGMAVFAIMGQFADDISFAGDGSNLKAITKLSEFEPATNVSEVSQQIKVVQKGIAVDGTAYRDEVELKQGQNYILRTVAYRLEAFSLLSSFRIQGSKIPLNKRDDMIVIFRAVRQYPDKSWLIVWRTVARTPAPAMVIKRPSGSKK